MKNNFDTASLSLRQTKDMEMQLIQHRQALNWSKEELEKQREQREDIEASKKKIEWGSQIRNYVMQPYQMVKDVRTGIETSAVADVLDGNIDEFLKGFLMEYGKSKS